MFSSYHKVGAQPLHTWTFVFASFFRWKLDLVQTWDMIKKKALSSQANFGFQYVHEVAFKNMVICHICRYPSSRGYSLCLWGHHPFTQPGGEGIQLLLLTSTLSLINEVTNFLQRRMMQFTLRQHIEGDSSQNWLFNCLFTDTLECLPTFNI